MDGRRVRPPGYRSSTWETWAVPSNEFSEFTFGFAFTQEVTSFCWDALSGAPEMPSLFDEGKGKGFDAALGLWGWSMFVQFKRGSLLTRSTALEWDWYLDPYFRFDIYPSSRSSQHEDLLALESAAALHWVAYVAPVFHTNRELNELFMSRQVVDNVRMISPRAIGPLDGEVHHVTYQTASDVPIRHSEPTEIEALSTGELRSQLTWPGLSQTDLGRVGSVSNGPSPVVLDTAFFDTLADQMVTIRTGDADGRYLDLVASSVSTMTSFGRARTLGRLLFGGELIALPAGVPEDS